MKNSQRVFIILAVLWMLLIFVFSSRTAVLSSADSSFVGKVICKLFVPDFSEMSVDEQEALIASISYPIRKIAHATEYAILGFIVTMALPFRKLKYSVLLAWGIGTLYAITDEVHQLFVAGRSGQITDVIIDSLGCLAGVLFGAFLIALLAARRKRKKNKKK